MNIYYYVTLLILFAITIFGQNGIYNMLDISKGCWVFEENSTGLIAKKNLIKSEVELDRVNAYWLFDCSNKNSNTSLVSYFVELHLLNFTEGEIGLSTQEYFKPGWNLTGLFYFGGLSDGQNLLRTYFGPGLETNDRFGMYVNYTDNAIIVSYFHNNIYLGDGFEISKTNLSQLYPTVSFEAIASLELTKLSNELPEEYSKTAYDVEDTMSNLVYSYNQTDSILYNQKYKFSFIGTWQLKFDGIVCETESDWKLIPMNDNIKNSSDFVVTLSIALLTTTLDYTEYTLILNGINSVKFTLRHYFEKNEWVTPDTRISTNIDGPSDFLLFERWVNAFLYQPQDLQLKSITGPLIIYNDDCLSVFVKFYPTPVYESPFLSSNE